MKRTIEWGNDPWLAYSKEPRPRLSRAAMDQINDELRAFMRTAEFRTLKRQLDLRGERLHAWRELAIRGAVRRAAA